MMRQSTSFLLAVLLVGVLNHVTSFSLQMSAATGKVNVIAGATGYIGKSVVRESVRQGYKTIALVRDKSKVESTEGKALYGQFLEGAELVECDVTDIAKLTKVSGGI
jgi:NAD(P)-dependent dehydrogenase (short-subunit alcohol dehydrogenase family)